MMKSCQKINLQEPQRNRNATANFVNFVMTSTVHSEQYPQTPGQAHDSPRLSSQFKA